ncbi:MAG: TatD family hydrolase [Aeriscardovia sp.]|nr:TatD family hydrolase [Aeriscardovia sp.]
MKHREKGWAQGLNVEGMADDHTHILSLPSFAKEEEIEVLSPEKILSLSREAGVREIMEVACEEKYFEEAAKFAEKNEGVYYALAIHPLEALKYEKKEDYEAAFEKMKKVMQDFPKKLSAVGESGMDFFHVPLSTLPLQKKALLDHISLSNDLGLPLQIHDHLAHREILEALKEGGAKKVVFHSFSGNADFARAVCREGWYLSFSGMITFKNASEVREAFLAAPRDKILAETDAPSLTPAPFRGRPNAPWMLGYTLRFMGDLLNVPASEIAKITRENALKAYEAWR